MQTPPVLRWTGIWSVLCGRAEQRQRSTQSFSVAPHRSPRTGPDRCHLKVYQGRQKPYRILFLTSPTSEMITTQQPSLFTVLSRATGSCWNHRNPALTRDYIATLCMHADECDCGYQ